MTALIALSWKFSAGAASVDNVPPPIKREFRGAWIASMSNIDWPSKPGLNASEQKAELRLLLDAAVKLHLNAVFLQVRPASDALYKSAIEPWSEFLTGMMGKAPEPAYDPLQFAVEEAHARSLELHAWFNPYRAGFSNTKYTSPQHVTKRHPTWIRRYGSLLWLDPCEAGVQEYVTKVILDVVRRYDIDGVHLDDYFYPYPEALKPGVFREFPDESGYRRFIQGGGKLPRKEWRRENVNKLVQRLHREIRLQKPWISFGISPFGIWRPGFPTQIKGLDAYDSLFADSRHWLINGWVDYLSPQLYWPIDQREQSFPVLYEWWSHQSEKGVPIWPGGDMTKVNAGWPFEEIANQIGITRKSAQPGFVLWHLGAASGNATFRGRLANEVYSEPAVVPQLRNGAPLAKPTLSVTLQSTSRRLVRWSLPPNERPASWVVQTRRGAVWHTEVLPATARSKELSIDVTAVAITAVSRFHALSTTSAQF